MSIFNEDKDFELRTIKKQIKYCSYIFNKDSLSVLIVDKAWAVILKYDKECEPAPYLIYKTQNVKACINEAKKINLHFFTDRLASDIAYLMDKDDIIPYSMFIPVAEMIAKRLKETEFINKTRKPVIRIPITAEEMFKIVKEAGFVETSKS